MGTLPPPALTLMTALRDARYPLAQAVEAFARAASPGVMKVLLKC